MRIRRVLVRNFRGVRYSELSELEDLVVLAGQNGSGKSCILDAVRLVKSVYGGYQPNEFHQWFGEFQINFSNDPRAFQSLFNDQALPLEIEIDVELHPEERRYLKENAEPLITNQAWRAIVPELHSWRSLNAAPFTAQFRSREAEVNQRAKDDLQIFNSEIDLNYITASISINPNDQPKFNPSKVLELVFSTFDPKHFGIIDYHGPHRNFGREAVSNINVNIEAIEDQKRQSALYNYNAKYANVKSEMASLYVREALAARAGKNLKTSESVTETLQELFSTFFPYKEFLGPQPNEDGSLSFPVRVGGRESHDLDELSSGEKEILYGYLRLRNSAPKNSVILLDEPELHLNPRLTRNLPAFYYRRLARALGNQVWLVTHSDAILRESVGRSGFSVYHITPSAHVQLGINQAKHVQADHDLEKAVIELVGDLAAYNPGGRIVIFEGEDSDFDVRMCSELFPDLPEKANLISGTNKSRVRGLHSLLQKLADTNALPSYRIFSVTDRDSDIKNQSAGINQYSWNVYHIENYLLEPKYIHSALHDLTGGRCVLSVADVEQALSACASETITSLTVHAASQIANKHIIAAINIRISPDSGNVSADISSAVAKSSKKMSEVIDAELRDETIFTIVDGLQKSFSDDIISGKWRENFRGRDILKRFVGKYGEGVKYELFRNLVIARMRDNNFRPEGMASILDPIVAPLPVQEALPTAT